MTLPVSLVKVGNSNAIIIPSKVLKQMNIQKETKLELSLEPDCSLQIRKMSSSGAVVFPKVKLPSVGKLDYQDLISIDRTEYEMDERAAYILGK